MTHFFFCHGSAKWCREPQQPKSTRMYGCHSYVLCHTSIPGRKGEVLCPSGDKANFAASRHGFGEETTNGKAFLGCHDTKRPHVPEDGLSLPLKHQEHVLVYIVCLVGPLYLNIPSLRVQNPFANLLSCTWTGHYPCSLHYM